MLTLNAAQEHLLKYMSLRANIPESQLPTSILLAAAQSHAPKPPPRTVFPNFQIAPCGS